MIEADKVVEIKQVFDEEDGVEGSLTKQSTTDETELKQIWPYESYNNPLNFIFKKFWTIIIRNFFLLRRQNSAQF